MRIPVGLDEEVHISGFFFFAFSHTFSIRHTLGPFVCPLWSNKSEMTTKDKDEYKKAEDNTNQWRKSTQEV